MELACVYVVKEHLGFYTDPTVTEMQEGEELNDFMWRVLTEEWLWNRDNVKSMCEADKVRCFKLHPMFPKVWGVISSFMHDSRCRYLIPSREHSELHVRICESLKIVERLD